MPHGIGAIFLSFLLGAFFAQAMGLAPFARLFLDLAPIGQALRVVKFEFAVVLEALLTFLGLALDAVALGPLLASASGPFDRLVNDPAELLTLLMLESCRQEFGVGLGAFGLHGRNPPQSGLRIGAWSALEVGSTQ